MSSKGMGLKCSFLMLIFNTALRYRGAKLGKEGIDL